MAQESAAAAGADIVEEAMKGSPRFLSHAASSAGNEAWGASFALAVGSLLLLSASTAKP